MTPENIATQLMPNYNADSASKSFMSFLGMLFSAFAILGGIMFSLNTRDVSFAGIWEQRELHFSDAVQVNAPTKSDMESRDRANSFANQYLNDIEQRIFVLGFACFSALVVIGSVIVVQGREHEKKRRNVFKTATELSLLIHFCRNIQFSNEGDEYIVEGAPCMEDKPSFTLSPTVKVSLKAPQFHAVAYMLDNRKRFSGKESAA